MPDLDGIRARAEHLLRLAAAPDAVATTYQRAAMSEQLAADMLAVYMLDRLEQRKFELVGR